MARTRSSSRQLRRLLSSPGSRQLIQLWLNANEPISALSLEVIVADLVSSPPLKSKFVDFLLVFVQGCQGRGLLSSALRLSLWLAPDPLPIIEYVAQVFDDLCEEDGLRDLDRHDLLEVLQSPALFVRYESTIAIAAERWVGLDRFRAGALDCFLDCVRWSRWSAADSDRLRGCFEALRRSTQRHWRAATTSAEADRYRSVRMGIPQPDRVLESATKAFRMASCRWEAILEPDPYGGVGQRFYRLRLQLVSGPMSSLPLQVRILFSCSLDPYYDTDWVDFGDVHVIGVFPIGRLGASLASLVVDHHIEIEFRFKVLQ